MKKQKRSIWRLGGPVSKTGTTAHSTKTENSDGLKTHASGLFGHGAPSEGTSLQPPRKVDTLKGATDYAVQIYGAWRNCHITDVTPDGMVRCVDIAPRDGIHPKAFAVSVLYAFVAGHCWPQLHEEFPHIDNITVADLITEAQS